MSVEKRFRMDFDAEVISFDEKTGVFEVILKPNPARYEWREVQGESCLYDKLDNIFITKKALYDSVNKSRRMPIYFQPPKIKDAEQYIQSRTQHIENMLDGKYELPTFQDKSEEFLQSLSSNELAFAIVSLDIVGSTKLAVATDPRTYSNVITVLLFELSEVIPKFHGHVLKYTGDGFIAYFPEPSFITKNDLAIDCALTLRALLYRVINPVLEKRAFPAIGIRIGLDSGEAYVVTVGSPETKQHKDIIGAVVNLAAKIQAQASPGEILLGATTERNLHFLWRSICEPADLGEKWDYRTAGNTVYQLHRVKNEI